MTREAIIVGAGAGGMMAAVTAAERGVPVLVIDAADRVGGSLTISSGQLSAAGTVLQARRGIVDSPDSHYADVMRISRGTADPALVRLAVDNAARALDWLLDRGMDFLPEHPVEGLAHEPYTAARYYWGPDYGRSILRVLQKEFEAHVATGRIELCLNTTLTELILDDRRAVVGVRATLPDGTERTWHAGSTLLATGGYNSNKELFEELSGHPAYGGNSYPHNKGGGLLAARRIGAGLRGRDNYLSSFGVIMDGAELGAKLFLRHIHHPQERRPWEIYVNTRGHRFVAEDEPSVDVREHALLVQPHLRRFVVFDARVLRESPPMVTGKSNADLSALFDAHPMFTSGRTVPELARKAGIDPAGLIKTIGEYNGALGTADPFGRAHRPLPLAEPPFYAIRVQGASVTSTVGLSVDDRFRVLDTARDPIEGLFAIGELLGSGQLMGRSFCGGMMATPALTFGLMFGETLPRA